MKTSKLTNIEPRMELQIAVRRLFTNWLYQKPQGGITAEMYDKKLKEYKLSQADLLQQMQEHSTADGNYYHTAARLLDICKRAVEIFESSEPAEKRVFLNFILQNSVLKARTPMFTLKNAFAGIVEAHETHNWGA